MTASRVAWFISPHGYGHAARAAAVMEALTRIDPTLGFEIFTKVPSWFFKDSLFADFNYHDLLTDIGLAQRTPLEADLPETVAHLDEFLPLDSGKIRDLAGLITGTNCGLVICDIAPMGIRVAGEAGIPSVLVENFTWDWIYEGYREKHGALGRHIPYLRDLFRKADHHIQTEPVCFHENADLTTLPVCREARTPRRETRRRLGLKEEARVVMITMGGIRERFPFLEGLKRQKDIHFLIPGGSERRAVRDNLVLLPHHSAFFHPDLLQASDAVIGKVGYSTLAECYEAGVPFGFIERTGFRESPELVSFIQREMKGFPIRAQEFYDGTWLGRLPDLLSLPRIRRPNPRGAAQAANYIRDLLESG